MIRYMIIEDEYILANRLERLIRELKPAWSLVARSTGIQESIPVLKSEKIDLIFMDIELSDGNCFELFDLVEIKQPVIFTTAYDQYALQAFKADCVNYLLKPIRKEDLEATLQKLERLASFPINPKTHTLLIPQGNTFIPIETSEVAWFSKNDRYTELCTFQQQYHLLNETLNTLEEKLDPKQFFRTSRHCILNKRCINSIQRISNGRLNILTNPPSEQEILVTQARREDFLNWLEN